MRLASPLSAQAFARAVSPCAAWVACVPGVLSEWVVLACAGGWIAPVATAAAAAPPPTTTVAPIATAARCALSAVRTVAPTPEPVAMCDSLPHLVLYPSARRTCFPCHVRAGA